MFLSASARSTKNVNELFSKGKDLEACLQATTKEVSLNLYIFTSYVHYYDLAFANEVQCFSIDVLSKVLSYILQCSFHLCSFITTISNGNKILL